MIKLFRHIRKSLLEQNKTSKYFKYAIGEIILVVIGILIALSINNWNENRKEIINMGNSLQSIKEELLFDIKFLNDEMESKANVIPALKHLLKENYDSIDVVNVVNFFGSKVGSKKFGITYYALKEERKLNQINNKSLKKDIIEYYEILSEEHLDFYNWHDRFVADNIDPFVINKLPAYHTEENLKLLMKEIKLPNIIMYQTALYTGYIRMNKQMIEKAKLLMVEIDSYLKTNK